MRAMRRKRRQETKKEARVSELTKDHLGREMSAEDILATLAVMLGWKSTPSWPVLERDLREKMRQLEDFKTSELERDYINSQTGYNPQDY